MQETRPSICRVCPAFCGVLVTVDEGRVVRVTGDPDNPLYEGYSCVKGRALPEQHNGPHRLLTSVARGADGVHRPIASATAMDEIATKLAGIVERHGPRSVAMYVGTNTLPYAASPGVAHAWLRALGTPMFFTSNTIDQPGKQIAAALHGGWHAGEQDFETADTWILVGINPLISKSAGIPSCNPTRRLKEAVERGLALIVIDPRRTETARRARIHIQPRPGEDPTILAGLLHVILAEGLYDRAFVEENADGFDALAARVAPYTPEYVARRADVPAAQVIEAARTFATASRGCVNCGTGPSFAMRGTLTEYLARVLNTVCGRWARAGERAIKPNVLLPAFAPKAQPYAPYKAWGYGERMRVRGLTDAACGLPTAALADEILLEGEGQVRALICLGGNPMMAWPDQRKTLSALRSLELLVTLDVEMSATARLADYVIATKLTLETEGMTQPAELLKYFGPGIGYMKPYAQYSPALVAPPPGSDLIEEWELFYGLAVRMGLRLHMAVAYGWGRHSESKPHVVPLDMERKPTSAELFDILTARARIPLTEVKKHPHGHIFEEVVETVAPRDADCTTRLEVGDPYMMQELAEVRAESFETAHDEARYPFRLIPRRSDRFINSSGRSLPMLAGKRPYNPAYMHPTDLRRLGLVRGDVVRIRSRHDFILGVVDEDRELRPGLVSMTHAFGGLPDEECDVREVGSNTGRLVRADDEYDPVSGLPRMGNIPVAVEAC